MQSQQMQFLSPSNFTDYELIDVGNFEKLERFGKYITIRPEPQALWNKSLNEKEWMRLAHVKFIPKSSSTGDWKKLKDMPDQWRIRYNINGNKRNCISFRLGLTGFKHVGIFPEQACNWDFIFTSISKLRKQTNTNTPKVLNLFAYTGGASLAAKAAGADVVHVDSIKQVVSWSKENMELSDLRDIRWVVEDALKFVKREEKRGNKYNGIILDPPAYGHGPKGEKWKIEDNISTMMKSVLNILDEKHFLILNAYSLGLSPLVMQNLIPETGNGKLSSGELFLPSSKGTNVLPLGVFGRYCNF